MIGGAVPVVSKFLRPPTPTIPPSPRRLRSLWKSKHFHKPTR